MATLHRAQFADFVLTIPAPDAPDRQLLDFAAILALSSLRAFMQPEDWERIGNAYRRTWDLLDGPNHERFLREIVADPETKETT